MRSRRSSPAAAPDGPPARSRPPQAAPATAPSTPSPGGWCAASAAPCTAGACGARGAEEGRVAVRQPDRLRLRLLPRVPHPPGRALTGCHPCRSQLGDEPEGLSAGADRGRHADGTGSHPRRNYEPSDIDRRPGKPEREFKELFQNSKEDGGYLTPSSGSRRRWGR